MYICIHSIIVIGYAVRPGDWYCGQGHQGVFLFCFEDLVNRKMPRQLFHTTVLPLDIFIPSFLFLSPLSIYISFSPSTLSVCSLLSTYCHVSLSWFFSPIWLPIPCSICVSFPSLYHFSLALCSLCLNFLRPSQYTSLCLLSLSLLFLFVFHTSSFSPSHSSFDSLCTVTFSPTSFFNLWWCLRQLDIPIS